MDAKNIAAINTTIHQEINEFFRETIAVHDRVISVLSATDDPGGETVPSSAAFLNSALFWHPSIGEAVEACGINLGELGFGPLYHITNHEVLSLLRGQLEVWFRVIDHPNSRIGYRQPMGQYLGRPTKAFLNVRKNRELTAADIVRGCLESRYMDDRIGPRGDGGVSTNDLVGSFEKQLGADRKTHADNIIDERKINAFCDNLSTRLEQLPSIDPSLGAQQFVLYYEGKRVRIRPFGVWGAHQYQEAPLPDGSLWIARSNVLQPVEHGELRTLEAFEELLNSDLPEREFQQFFEDHPHFLLTLGDYKRAHPQLILHEDDGGQLVPDFFLEKLTSDFCDICDLKRPTADLVRLQRHRTRFRDAVREAISQLAYYREWFEDRTHREAFKTRYGLNAYKPRVVVIIGRQRHFYDDIERIRLESELPGWVSLKTYDDVIASARRWRDFSDRANPKAQTHPPRLR